jgi:hypothetical protein
VHAPPVRATLAAAEPVLPHQRYFPMRLEHIDAYRALAADLHALTNEDNRFAVFASGALADDMLTALDPALESRIAASGHVDTRDGFRMATAEARYAVVTEKPDLHLRPESQRVISIPNNQIISGQGMGAGYRRLRGPYVLANGARAFIYEHTHALSGAERQAVIAELRAYYPNWVERPIGFVPPGVRK